MECSPCLQADSRPALSCARYFMETNVKFVSYNDTARSEAAGWWDGLLMWKAAEGVLNSEPWKAERGWSSSLGVGGWLKTLHYKINHILWNVTLYIKPERVVSTVLLVQ
jgi:hypothetical protein